MRWNYRKCLFTLVVIWSGSYAFAELVEVLSKDSENSVEQTQTKINSDDIQSRSKLKETLSGKSSDKVANKSAEILARESQTKNVTENSSEKTFEKSKKNIVKNSGTQ